MTIRNRPGWTPEAELATAALNGLREKYSPRELEEVLNQKASGQNATVLDVLRQSFSALGVVRGGIDNHLSQMVFEEVSSKSDSDKFIDLLSKILNLTPTQLAKVTTDRIDHGVAEVTKDAMIQAQANVIERKALTAADVGALEDLPATLKALGLDDVGELAATYVSLFQEISGAPAVWEPDNVFRLFQEHGDHLRTYFRPEVRLALLPADEGDKAPSEATLGRFESFMDHFMVGLDEMGVLPTTGVVADGSDVGLSGILTRKAAEYPEVHRGGIAPGIGWQKPPARVDRLTMFGDDKNGKAATELFWDVNANATLVVVDPSAADIQRIKENARAGGDAIVLCSERPKPKELNNLKGVALIDLNVDAPQAAAEAASYLRGRRQEQKDLRPMSVAEHSIMSSAPDKIRDVRLWAKKESTKYRLLRLKNQVLASLHDNYPQAELADLTKWSMDFAQQLISHTHGIDNFKNNGEWQAAAHKAVEASCKEVQDIHDQLGLNIMFASWFGIREFDKSPGYFDEKTGDLEHLSDFLETVDSNKANAFDLKVYAEIRLDAITEKFLKAKDSDPEIFLGSAEEMQLYYRSKGFEPDITTHDSNGTYYHYFKSTKDDVEPVMVIHGVDCEARMKQLAGLMKVKDIDPNRCVVRGEVSRVRENNRSLLQHRISEITTQDDMQMEIAAAVIGNKNQSVEALLEMAGVSAEDAVITTHGAGPFRMVSVEVTPVGSDVPQVMLAFAPAYGELTEDAGRVLAAMGVKNVVNLGGGGSLNKEDEVNDIHQVEEVFYGDRRIGFAGAKGEGIEASDFLKPIRLPKGLAKSAVNMFSPSPLQQNKDTWLPWTKEKVSHAKKPTANVDQETAALQAGLHQGSLEINGLALDGTQLIEGFNPPRRDIYLQQTLIQSQVIGADNEGSLANSTVGAGYEKKALIAAKHFFEDIGIGGVVCRDGVRVIDGAKPGRLNEQTSSVVGTGEASVKEVMPNMSGEIQDWGVPGIEQYRGERRMLVVRAETFTTDDQDALEAVLGEIDPSDCFVVVDASDRHNKDVRESAAAKQGASAPKTRMVRRVAQQYGFETVVLSTEAEQHALEGAFNRILTYKDPAEKAEAYESALEHRNAQRDPNYSIPINLVLGAERPKAHTVDAPPYGMSEANCDAFVAILADVHEEVFAEKFNALDAAGQADFGPDKRAAYQKEQRPEVLRRVAERWPEAGEVDAAKLDQVQVFFDYMTKRAKLQGHLYTGGMDQADIASMADWVKEEFGFAIDGGVRMFADGLTHKTPGFRHALEDRYERNLADGTTRVLPARTGEEPLDKPKVYRLEELDEVFGVAGTNKTRKALWLQGASRDSWPLLSSQSRHALHLLAVLTPKLMREKKDDFVPLDGATDWGWEKILNDAFAADGWHVLGTASQNVLLTEDQWEMAPGVHRMVMTGMDWTGVATPVINDIVGTYGGFGILAGGGYIAKLQGESQLAHGTKLRSITGLTASKAGLDKVIAGKQKNENKAAEAENREPKKLGVRDLSAEEKRNAAGASVELGEKFMSSGISTLNEYCEDLEVSGELAKLLEAAGLPKDTEIKIHDDVKILEKLAKAAGIDVALIRGEYAKKA